MATSEMVRVETLNDEERTAVNLLTTSERRDALVEAGLDKAARMVGTPRRTTVTVQAVHSAFSDAVPEHLWQDAGTASTWRGLERIYTREWNWVHPQPNAWSGHVRCMSNGVQLDYGAAFRMLGGPEERLPNRYQ